MQRFAVLAVWILLFSATPALADFYRWVDKDGKEFFTNDPKQVPQEYRGSVTTVKPDESRVRVEEKPIAPMKASVKAPEHKDKYGRGEAYWRKRAEKYRKQLRDFQDELDLIVKQEKDEEEKPRILTSKIKKALETREKKKAQLERKIEKTKKALAVNLPEEARMADAYPGWVSE